MAQIRINRAKQKLAAGQVVSTVTGPGLDTDLIDLLGPVGFDAIWLEAEHGPVDYGDIPDLTRACDLWGMTSIVRVNRNEPGVIYRTLDLGAQAIVVPHVNTADEARAVVAAAKFHPVGQRGIFTSRQGYGVDDFTAAANAQSLVVVLIEDIVAVNNLPEILAVEHIDVFYVAPGDLGQSLGYVDRTHPEVLQTVERALETIVQAGRIAGTLVTEQTVAGYLQMGVRFTSTGWTTWMESGARGFLAQVAATAI